MFDERREDWAREREQLQSLLTDAELTAARRTTINAHYTDPAYVDAMWAAMQRLGFEGGRVLEPGSGAGTFMGMAPVGTEMTGIELDPLTASMWVCFQNGGVLCMQMADRPGGEVAGGGSSQCFQ